MRTKALVLALFGVTFILALPGVASADAFTVLHSFTGPDGETPAAPLVQGTDGFLYGVAAYGGNFALLQSLSPLFPGEGSQPKRGVVQASNGLFYGTTELGGYFGEVFRIDAAGSFTVIHCFDAYASDGGSPVSGLD